MGEGVRLRESIVLHGATLQVGTRAHTAAVAPREAEGRGEPLLTPSPHIVLFGRSTRVFCTASWAGGAP